MKHKVNDSPEFDTKKSLAKWVKLTLSNEEINKGVTYTDGILELYIDDSKKLFGFLEIEND